MWRNRPSGLFRHNVAAASRHVAHSLPAGDIAQLAVLQNYPDFKLRLICVTSQSGRHVSTNYKNQSNKTMELKEIKNPDHETMWKAARWGVIIFCVIHFLFEILTGNSKSAALPVFFNFWVSGWYIKGQIAKGKQMKNLLLMGLSVSGVVFLIRLALGTVFYLLMTK